MYLGLGVDATQIQTQYPMHPTQDNKQDHKNTYFNEIYLRDYHPLRF